LADTRFAQKISQVPGVGMVSLSGGQRPAVRIHANLTAMAAYGLSLEDLRSAVSLANVNMAKGSFDGPRQSFTITSNDQLFSSEEYKPLIIAYRNEAPVRLSDVAEVLDAAEDERQAAWMDDRPAVIMNIQRQPGANVIAVADRVHAMLPQLRDSLPPDVTVDILADRTTGVRASVKDVQFELMLAVALVVAVISSSCAGCPLR
jgi:multidrug efflux pump